MEGAAAKVRLGTLNMRDGRRGKMHHAAKCLLNHRVDIAILTETKIQTNFSQLIERYQLVHSIGHTAHSGGVSLAYRTDDARYSVESVQCRTNLVSFNLVTPQHRFIVVGVYCPPSNPAASEDLGNQVTSILRKNAHLPRIILGDLNANPHRQPLRPHDVIMAANWTEWGIEDLGSHFRTRRGTRFTTWHQTVEGRTISSLCDFVLTDKRCVFTRLRAAEPRYYDSDHRIVLADMSIVKTRGFRRLLKGKKTPPTLPYSLPHPILDPLLDTCLTNKHQIEPNNQAVDKSTWVSATLMQLYNDRSKLRKLRHTRSRRRRLRLMKKKIRRQIRHDKLAHAESACNKIQAALAAKDLDSAWGWCKAWYKEATFRASRPSPLDLQEISTLFSQRYAADGVDREDFPTHVPQFDIDDSPPTEDEIIQAVGRLRNRKAKGHFGTRAEHVKAWLSAAQRHRREHPHAALDANHPWLVFVDFVREVFIHGQTPERLGVAELVILPKPGGGVRGIGLLEPLWKVISSIIDFRIKTEVEWDGSLHGFLPNRSTGTAIMDTRLRSDLATAKMLPYHRIYIDLTKAYDCVDRSVLLRLLEAYGVGPKIRGILQTQWAAQQFITKQAGEFGPVLRTSRGVTQGDIVSPTLFNIVIDAVSREWKHQLNVGPASDPIELDVGFYADDSVIGGTVAVRVQTGLDQFVQLMGDVGLAVNVTKTESQTHLPGGIHHSWSSPAYIHRITGDGLSPTSRRRQEVTCPHCQLQMRNTSLQRHLETQHQDYVANRVTARTTLFQNEIYEVEMPTQGTYCACPVHDCPGGSYRRADLRKHFRTRHPHCTLAFFNELTTIACPDCDRRTAVAQLTRHRNSEACRAQSRRTRRLVAVNTSITAADVRFHIANTQLEEARVFKYLGKPTPSYCTDITAVLYNITKARRKWTMLRRIIAAQFLPPTIASIFYKAVVQSVLLYGSETWVLTKRILDTLEAFHHRIARQITGTHIFRTRQGVWNYPAPQETLRKAGLFTMREYIRRRRTYIRPFLQSHPVTPLGQQERQQQQRDPNNYNQKFIWDNLDEPLLREDVVEGAENPGEPGVLDL